MLSFSRLQRGLSSPNLIARRLNKMYFSRLGERSYNTNGIDIFNEEWDNLIILDACRYDLFKQHSQLEGELNKRVSRGSSTTEFLDGNFSQRQLHDVVYVTSNPQYYRHRETINCQLHDVIEVWQRDGWNDELGTVLPETTTEFAKMASEEYDDKRILVHYIQPHYPFLNSEITFDKGQLEDPSDDAAFWRRIMTGKLSVDVDRLWQLYAENLKSVLNSVVDLLKDVRGRTVVTSDHGNMLGERSFPLPIKEWGHPRGIHTPELVEVPWLICDNGRKKTTSDPPVERTTDYGSDNVEERLSDLGYV